MVQFPYAKINLGLNVIARREDGYHDIETVMVPIPLFDALEITVDPTLAQNTVVYTRSGLPVPGVVENDLCYKAIRCIQAIRSLPGLRMHLHKVIPMGAGLGGGSSDATHTLLLVDRLCNLALGKEILHHLAAKLGSDCPFFLAHSAQLAYGRGELLEPVHLDLTGLWLLLVEPGIHVSTAEVYKNTVPSGKTLHFIHQMDRKFLRTWHTAVRNSMEPYVLGAYPEVAHAKAEIDRAGATYSAMSGSGSTVFGLFTEQPPELALPASFGKRVFRL